MGRRTRHAREEVVAASDAKVTETTPSQVAELVKTITITPGPRQYVHVKRIYGEVTADSAAVAFQRNAILQAKVVGFEEVPSGVAVRTFGSSSGGIECTNDIWGSGVGSRDVDFKGAVGVPVVVEFYLIYDTAVAPTTMCTRNCRVTHDLVTLTRSGGLPR